MLTARYTRGTRSYAPLKILRVQKRFSIHRSRKRATYRWEIYQKLHYYGLKL